MLYLQQLFWGYDNRNGYPKIKVYRHHLLYYLTIGNVRAIPRYKVIHGMH